MIIYEMKWTNNEKKIARTAFNNAYKREIEEIKSLLIEKVSHMKTDSDLWAVEGFLNNKRKIIDEKYDFRYSSPFSKIRFLRFIIPASFLQSFFKVFAVPINFLNKSPSSYIFLSLTGQI